MTMPLLMSHIRQSHADERPWLPSDVRQRLEDAGRFDIRGTTKARPAAESLLPCDSSGDGGAWSAFSGAAADDVIAAERG